MQRELSNHQHHRPTVCEVLKRDLKRGAHTCMFKTSKVAASQRTVALSEQLRGDTCPKCKISF